jgi:hypothetical protein
MPATLNIDLNQTTIKNPAMYALERLHAELGGQLLQNKKEAKWLAQCMKHVEAVLKMLQPGLAEGCSHFVTSMAAPVASGWGLHPLESAALSRRTPKADIGAMLLATWNREICDCRCLANWSASECQFT